jgi:hypothetical protein
MSKVAIANSAVIRSKDNLTGQAFNDVENHLSNHLTQIQLLQKQMLELQKKVGK